MGIAAAQIGFDHEAGEDVRVAGGEAGGFEGPLDECRQRSRLNSWNIGATLRLLLCGGLLGHFPSERILSAAMSSRSKADYNSILRRHRPQISAWPRGHC